MPIEIDPQQISVAPSGRYIREFKTDLPRPTLNLNPLAEGIGQVGGEMLATQAKITGREAGLNAVVQKDENGNYAPPPPPDTFGETARLAYNTAIEQTYTNSVYRDVERGLNEIANKPNTPPEQRIQLMNTYIDSSLNSVDPKYKGQLNVIFGREFNQRQASILNQARSDDAAYRSHALQGDTKNFVNSAIDAWSAGDFEAGSAHLAEGRRSYETSIRLKTTDENLIADQMRKFDEQANGFRWFNDVYQKVRDAARDKTANPEDISRLSKMLQEGATPTGATAFGVTDTDIVKNMSREARVHMRQIVNTLDQEYTAQFAQSNEERKAQELHDFLTAGGTFKPDTFSDKDLANATRKALVDANLSPYSAEGAKALAFKFNGVLPHEMYKTYFAGIHENDAGTPEGAARIRERLDLYRALNDLPTRSGIQDRTEVIGATERNYLRVLESKMEGGYGLQEADRAVKAIFKEAGGLDQKSITNMVHSSFRAASGTSGPIDPKDVIMGAIGTASFPLFSSPSYAELPKAARDQIESSIATSISQGINYNQAAKDAGRDFVNNWTKSKDVIAGLVGNNAWVQKKDELPTAYDALTGQGNKDYIKPYIDKILAERLNDAQKSMLGELKYGDNIKLEPTGIGGSNRSYYLTYYKPEALGFQRLTDKNGQPLMIIPQGAKDAYEKYTAAENQYRTITDRSAGSNVPDITFASTPKPKDTNQKVALIAAGTNDWGLAVGPAMDNAVGNNIKQMVDLARSRGQQPVIVMPNGSDPKFANVRDSIQRAVNDIGTDKVTVIEGKYDKNDPAHLNNASVTEITSKYKGAVVYGDSNAVRLGTRLGYDSKNINGLQTLVDATGNPIARVSAGSASIYETMKNHPVPAGSLANADPVNKPQLNIDLKHVDPLPSTSVILGREKSKPNMTEDKKKLLDAIGSKISEYNLDDNTSYILKTIGIESQMNPNAKNPNSSAFGLGQFTDPTWKQYGRGDRTDPVAQIDAFMRFTQDNIKSFERSYSRKPSSGELYLMHQQGAAGAIALLNNPNDNAMRVLERVVKNRETAVNSIYLNVPTDARSYSGSLTAKQFTDIWMNRFN